jgi:hypothetical protein
VRGIVKSAVDSREVPSTLCFVTESIPVKQPGYRGDVRLVDSKIRNNRWYESTFAEVQSSCLFREIQLFRLGVCS